MRTSDDLIRGPVIRTTYVCATDATPYSRVRATHKGGVNTTRRKTIRWENHLNSEANHLAAAEALLAAWPHENTLRIVARGHDDDAYYFTCQSQP